MVGVQFAGPVDVGVVVGAVPAAPGQLAAGALIRRFDGFFQEEFLSGVAAVVVGVDPVLEGAALVRRGVLGRYDQCLQRLADGQGDGVPRGCGAGAAWAETGRSRVAAAAASAKVRRMGVPSKNRLVALLLSRDDADAPGTGGTVTG